MYKAINNPACCNWKASGRYSQSYTYWGVRSLELYHICHTGTWLCAGMVLSLTSRLRPETQSCCRFSAMFWGQSLQSKCELIQGHNILLYCILYMYMYTIYCIMLQEGIGAPLTTGQPSSISSIKIYWTPWKPGSGWLSEVIRSGFTKSRCCKETITCKN